VFFGAAKSGIYGHHGPSTALGAGAGAEVLFVDLVFLRGVLTAVTGPRKSANDENISAWGLQPELMLGYDWRLGIFSLVPMLGVGATWTKLDIDLDNADKQSFSNWSFRGSCGLDLRFAISRSLNIVADAFIGAHSNRERFERDSNQDIIFATPLVDWSALLGVVFYP
jgi:hypothetical protein